MKYLKSYNEDIDNDWTSDTLVDRLPKTLKKTIKNFKSFFNNENDRIVSYTNILKDWRYSFDIEFDKQNYIYTFKVNDDLIEIHVLNSRENDIKVRVNKKEVNISTKVCTDFLNELRRINKSTHYFTEFIVKNITKYKEPARFYNDVERAEAKERITEFEVIKDGKIDFISLNQLYDFYEVPFDENSLNVFRKRTFVDKFS